MEPFLGHTLRRITPPQREREKIDLVFKTISEEVKKTLPKTEVFLGGSSAKNTQIKGNKELDVFLRFPKKTQGISKKAFRAIKVFKPEIVKGSRDYYNFFYKGFKVEIIPVLKIES